MTKALNELELPALRESVEAVKGILGDLYEEITIERAVLGLFFTGVKLSSGHGGLSFTPIKEIPEAVCCPSSAAVMPNSGKLKGLKASALIKEIFRPKVLKRALGIATLNALSTLCWERLGRLDYTLLKDKDAFTEVKIKKEDKVVVVGALWPMIKELLKNKNDFHILEMDINTLREEELPYFVDPKDGAFVLKEADVLVITGVTVLNDTLDGLLAKAPKAREVVVTGPTVSMLPDAFFKRGVTMLGGIIVTKPDELLDVISEGGSGYHFFAKSASRTVIKKGGSL